jgi:hypothetical protein
MSLSNSSNLTAIQGFAAEDTVVAGDVTVKKGTVFSMIDGGDVVYQGGGTITAAEREILVVPNGIHGMNISNDARVAGYFYPGYDPVIITEPTGGEITVVIDQSGNRITTGLHLVVEAENTKLGAWSWTKDGESIHGATGNMYTAKEAGTYVATCVSLAGNSATSIDAVVTENVITLPKPVVADVIVAEGDDAVFTVTGADDATLSWIYDGSEVSTSDTATLTNVQLYQDSTRITVLASNESGKNNTSAKLNVGYRLGDKNDEGYVSGINITLGRATFEGTYHAGEVGTSINVGKVFVGQTHGTTMTMLEAITPDVMWFSYTGSEADFLEDFSNPAIFL